jgi:hypothetical protein
MRAAGPLATKKHKLFQYLTGHPLACIVHSSISMLSRAGSGRLPASHRPVPLESFAMSYLKQKLSVPVVKYSAIAIASSLWVFGLIDQLSSSAAMMKYLLLSLLLAALAFI